MGSSCRVDCCLNAAGILDENSTGPYKCNKCGEASDITVKEVGPKLWKTLIFRSNAPRRRSRTSWLGWRIQSAFSTSRRPRESFMKVKRFVFCLTQENFTLLRFFLCTTTISWTSLTNSRSYRQRKRKPRRMMSKWWKRSSPISNWRLCGELWFPTRFCFLWCPLYFAKIQIFIVILKYSDTISTKQTFAWQVFSWIVLARN